MSVLDTPSSAKIVAVFDPPSVGVLPDEAAPPFLWIGEDGSQSSVDMRVHWMLETGFSSHIEGDDEEWKLSLRQNAGALLREVPEQLTDRILNQRTDMWLLLNQSGGNQLAQHCVLSAARRVYEIGGRVYCLVTQRAYSAAAHMTEPAIRRIALPHSRLMWHAQHDGQGVSGPEIVSDCTEKNREMFRQTLFPQALPEMERRFDQAATDPHNPLNDVYLSGQELKDWGYLQELHPKTEDIQAFFEREAGVPIDLGNWRRDPIARFFVRSRMEEYVMQRFGLRIEFYNEQPTLFMYRIPFAQTKNFTEEDFDEIMRDLKNEFSEFLES